MFDWCFFLCGLHRSGLIDPKGGLEARIRVLGRFLHATLIALRNYNKRLVGLPMALGDDLRPNGFHRPTDPIGQQRQGISLPITGTGSLRGMTKNLVLDGIGALDSAQPVFH